MFDVPEGYKLVEGFKADAVGVEEWFGFIIRSETNAILAFRGSHSHLDWIADAELTQVDYPFVPNSGMTHHGFTSIYSSCRDHLISVLETLPPSLALYVTGHSLGGALALLSVFDIAINTRFKNARMYNFGGPRVGNPRFAFYYDREVKESVRVANNFDIAPKYPPIIIESPVNHKYWFYRHVLGEFPISVQTGTLLGNHDIRTYLDALKELKYAI